MKRKRLHLLWTAAGAVLGLCSVKAHATPTASLSLTASGGNWTAYIGLDSASDNAGLATFAIDVLPGGGISNVQSYLYISPETKLSSVGTGLPLDQYAAEGFVEFASNGNGGSISQDNAQTPGDGVAITGGQDVAYDGNSLFNASDNAAVIENFGKAGAPTTYVSPYSGDTYRWSNTPGLGAEVAYGTYSGYIGSLSVVLDTQIGQGIQSLNYSQTSPAGGTYPNGTWVGPGNLTLDVVIPSSPIPYAGPNVSLTPPPVSDGREPLPQEDIAATSASVVTPSSADAGDQITYLGSPVLIQVNMPENNETFAYVNAKNLPSIDVLLKFVDTSTGTDPVNAQVLSDIENYIASVEVDDIAVTTVIPSSLSSQFPGTNFDLMLSASNFGGSALLDFSGFSDAAVSPGDLAVADIGLIPEPGSMGLLIFSGMALISRRRNRKCRLSSG
jgi:hypothetical protein